MSSTRTGRKKTVINYAKFGESSSDEDDFKEFTPPNKKAKQEKELEKRKKEDHITAEPKVKEEKKSAAKPNGLLEKSRKTEEITSILNKEEKKSVAKPEVKNLEKKKDDDEDFSSDFKDFAEEKKRVSVSEKIFQRELEKAIHLSQAETDRSQGKQEEGQVKEESGTGTQEEESEEQEEPIKEDRVAELFQDSSSDEEEDSLPQQSEASSSDEEEDSDYEKPKKKSKPQPKKNLKKSPVKKSSAVKKSKGDSKTGTAPTIVSLTPARPAAKPRALATRQSSGTSDLAAIHRAIVQPLKLPPSGIRVGLSRNMRVAKPLHSNVKIR